MFIGLELDNEENDGENPDIRPCESCCDAGREIIYDIRKMPYESYCQNCPDFILPDMVCVFNCGFHEYTNEPEKETWKPALPFLTKFPGVPLLFTSYTLTEADKDLDLILKCSEGDVTVDERKIENPFRSFRPFRDYEFSNNSDVFYGNSFMTILRKAS